LAVPVLGLVSARVVSNYLIRKGELVASVNTVTIIGNLTRDPELRYTTAGLAVCNAAVAVNRRWQNKATNEWEEKVSYIDVTVWGTQGQNSADSLRKGDRVFVSGRFEQRSWEDDAGNKRSKIELVADVVGPTLEWVTIPDIVRNERAESNGVESYSSDERPY